MAVLQQPASTLTCDTFGPFGIKSDNWWRTEDDNEWVSRKDEIRHLYLDKDLPLKTVQERLAANGFDATMRQYKTRLKAWGLDTKRIKTVAWCAMTVELKAREQEGLNTVFIARVRGGEVIRVTREMVTKQAKRRDRRGTPKQDLPDLTESRALLYKLGIEVCNELPAHTALQSSHVSRHISRATNLSNLKSPSASTRSSFEAVPLESSTDIDSFVSQTAAMAIKSFTTWIMPLQRPSSFWLGSDVSLMTSGYDVNDSPSAASVTSVERYDMAATVALFSLHSDRNTMTCETFRRCVGVPVGLLGQHIPMDKRRSLAAQWIAPYLLESIGRRNGLRLSDFATRDGAKTAFREMLVQSNEYMFPFCNSILAVLVSSDQVDLAIEFLTECCEVIDHAAADQELSNGTPFHFALAVYTYDPRRIACCVENFTRTNDIMSRRWGENSPNHIVCQYHYIWYAMSQKQYNRALSMLLRYLPTSEKVLGRSHIICVNCLVMISRVYEETGRKREAMVWLRTAINRLSAVAGLLEAYKFRVQLRLATLQVATGDYIAAEFNLNCVLDYRLGCFGLLDESTWFVIHALADLRKRQGYRQESESFNREWTKLWQEQVYRAADRCFQRYGTVAPLLCLVCRLPRTSPDCCL